MDSYLLGLGLGEFFSIDVIGKCLFQIDFSLGFLRCVIV